jgi:hypothetical protein
MRSWTSGLRRSIVWEKPLFLVALCIALSGCHSRNADVPPAIEFTKVPPAEEGGPNKLAPIEGRVTGARPNQLLVLYARSGTWWVQPMSYQPFTKLLPDSSWQSSTHLGTEYAALLVEPGYHPLAKLDALPGQGNGVAAVATVKGENAPPKVSKTIQFSGYEWKVRDTLGERNGSPHDNDPANASIDSQGFLHLRIRRKSDQWTCSEVIMTRSFGYGTYLFSVQDVSRMEPAAVLGLFTYDELGTNQSHREMDIEISRWGDPDDKNAQYVVQPYYVPANVSRFTAPAGLLTFSIHWEPGKATFETLRGSMPASRSHAISEHVFTSDVPSPGGESIRMNMCPFNYSKVPLQNEAEVVIERVQYLP